MTYTTEQVRRLYSCAYAWRTADGDDETDLSNVRANQAAEFDAWLGEHDVQVRTEARAPLNGTSLGAAERLLAFVGAWGDGVVDTVVDSTPPCDHDLHTRDIETVAVALRALALDQEASDA